MEKKNEISTPVLGEDGVVRHYMIPLEYVDEYIYLLKHTNIGDKKAAKDFKIFLSKFKIIQTDTLKTFIGNGN